MPTLNLNNINALYYENSLCNKLYKGSQQLYPQIGDPYLNNVILYLKGDDLNDNSPINRMVTNNNNVIVNTLIKKYGSGSLDFNRSNSLSFTGDDLNFTNQDFTVESWVYNRSFTPYNFLYGSWEGTVTLSSFLAAVNNTSLSHAFSESGFYTPAYEYYYNIPFNLNQWYHLAFTRQGNAFKSWVNGNLVDQRNFNISLYSSNHFSIGANNNNQSADALIDSFRITKGVARYIGNFDPEFDTYLMY